MRLTTDTQGVAYGIGIVAIFLFFVAAIYLLTTNPMNEIIQSFNSIVETEAISEETTQAFSFNITMFKSIPILAIFGVFLWGIVRALEKKGEDTGE